MCGGLRDRMTEGDAGRSTVLQVVATRVGLLRTSGASTFQREYVIFFVRFMNLLIFLPSSTAFV